MSRKIIVFLYVFTISVSFAFAQKSREKPNPEIVQMLRQVSAKNIETTIQKLVSFGTRNTLSEQNNPARGIGAARDYLFAEFQKISADCGNCLTVEKQSFLQPKAGRIPEPTTLTNVVATLKGTTNPERVYVVSGHYDSMCASPTDAKCDAPGANDDASGTAAVVEMARVMSKRKFDATIVFMTVPGEEQGLLGAAYFAEQAKINKTNIEAMFTNDIIGGVTTFKKSPERNSVRVFSEGVPSDETEAQAGTRRSVGGENDSPSRQLARFIKETAEQYSPKFRVMMIYRRDRYGRGGDHIPFVERGFSAVRFTEPNEDYDHQHQNVGTRENKFYGDTIEFVDFEYIANVTKINAASLASLALAPARPKNVVIVNRLGNDTELKWDALTESDLDGYEIVWRDTTSAIWTNSAAAGNVTNFVLKGMSKDNYFFGVRAVDKNGHRSPVSFPRPVR
ncbi:MAG: M20/M25/M40 family metallo-hydrolase [Acidobacteria bacterium]|nr:M20/M25/M40 family metallo-hydrolase [Acidobacteriota bacterium]